MDLLLILKKINLTSILKSTITNLINKKYNNQKIISESINNKLITLKESWMDGKERPNKLMLRLKEFKENCSNMLRKKIVYPTCWKLKTTSMKLWEDHWQTMKLKQEKYNICKPHVNNLTITLWDWLVIFKSVKETQKLWNKSWKKKDNLPMSLHSKLSFWVPKLKDCQKREDQVELSPNNSWNSNKITQDFNQRFNQRTMKLTCYKQKLQTSNQKFPNYINNSTVYCKKLKRAKEKLKFCWEKLTNTKTTQEESTFWVMKSTNLIKRNHSCNKNWEQ